MIFYKIVQEKNHCTCVDEWLHCMMFNVHYQSKDIEIWFTSDTRTSSPTYITRLTSSNKFRGNISTSIKVRKKNNTFQQSISVLVRYDFISFDALLPRSPHPWNSTAQDSCPSRPALPVSCTYVLTFSGTPQWIICRTSGQSMPITKGYGCNNNGDVNSFKICPLLSGVYNVYTYQQDQIKVNNHVLPGGSVNPVPSFCLKK